RSARGALAAEPPVRHERHPDRDARAARWEGAVRARMRRFVTRWGVGLGLAMGLGLAAPALGEEAPPEATENGTDGYSPPVPTVRQALRISGYVDVGFAVAQGNGSSFAPGDFRVPADYGSDAFAPAVNSLGEVASTDSGGRFVNGFLPRSVGIGN